MTKPFVLEQLETLKTTIDNNKKAADAAITTLQGQIGSVSNNSIYKQVELVGPSSGITDTTNTNYWFKLARIQNKEVPSDSDNVASFQGRMDIQADQTVMSKESYHIEFAFASRSGFIQPYLVFGGDAISNTDINKRVEFKIWEEPDGWYVLWAKLPTYCKYAAIQYIETDCTMYWEQLPEPTTLGLVWHSEVSQVQNIYVGTTGKVWTSDNDGKNSGLDSDKLQGLVPDSEPTASTIVERDATGQFKVGEPTDNNHVVRKVDLTAANVGLDAVENYGIATKAEAEEGTSDTKYVTPLKVTQAINSQIFNGKKYSSVIQLGNFDWTSIITVPSGYTATYSAADKGVVLNKITAGAAGEAFIITARLPIDPNATYVGVVKLKQISGDGRTFVGINSLDTNLNILQTDTVSGAVYNYPLVNGQTLAVGTSNTFRNTISGYNPLSPTVGSHNKFDPEASYFDIAILPAFGNTINNSKLVIESLEFYKLTIATKAEAEAGTDNTVYMTPLTTKQAIDKSSVLKTGSIMTGDLILHDSTNVINLQTRRTIGADIYSNGLYIDVSGNAILAQGKNGSELNTLYITPTGELNFNSNEVIDNSLKATQIQAETATDDIVYMTPLKTKNTIDKLAKGVFSRYVMTTSLLSTNASQWAKIATISLANDETFSAVLGFTSVNGNTKETNAVVSFIHRRADSLTPKTYLKVDVFSMNSLGNPSNLGVDSFKIIANNDTSSEIWINTKSAGQYHVHEITPSRSGTVSYNNTAAWQVSEPIGITLNAKSNGLMILGNKILDNSLLATKAQAETGTDDTNYMTALKTKNAIDKFAVTKSGTNIIDTGSLDVYANMSNALKLRSPVADDHVYLEMYPRGASQNTRGMYFGFTSSGANTLTLANDISDANINLVTNGTGIVQANGNRVIDTTLKVSQTQAEAGTDDTNYMTALKTNQGILAAKFPSVYGSVTHGSTLTKMSDILPIIFNNLNAGDVLHLKPVSNIEYYNGSSWIDWSTKLTEIQKLFSGKKQIAYFDKARFRFVVDSFQSNAFVHLWSVQQYLIGSGIKPYTLSIDSSTDKTVWTSQLNAVSATGLQQSLFMLQSASGTHRYYRVEFNVTGSISTSDYFGLGNIRGFSPSSDALLNSTGLPFNWGYSQIVDFKSTPTVNGNSIYHAANKPSADDVGLGLTADVGFKTVTASDYVKIGAMKLVYNPISKAVDFIHD